MPPRSLEQLRQLGYLTDDGLSGEVFGDFEVFKVGGTRVDAFQHAGMSIDIPATIDYPFTDYRPPSKPGGAKPDTVYGHRVGDTLRAAATVEWKDPSRLRTAKQKNSAAEQALFCALAMGAKVAVASDGVRFRYIDPAASLAAQELVEFDESRDFNQAVLADHFFDQVGVVRDPKPLAESVWQKIWMATKAEPKDCLLTFVEIFMLKFLSDNLPVRDLPADYRFDVLLPDPTEFRNAKGTTQIEYYVNRIRPKVKELFTERLVINEPKVKEIFGLQTVSSWTSIINGFAFLANSSTTTVASYNRVFCEIAAAFQEFGSLTNIDPEFKLRLYESFLRRSARQQRLGQFFTPRNVVAPMIRMARLNELPDDAVVLDPAAGVGGFLLESLLLDNALQGNVTFVDGMPQQRVKLIGVDVDVNTNILAKANMLLHLAESVRDPHTTTDALNQALANTFILLNENETLGALLHPPRNSVDAILTNPPYVTRGSKIYRREIDQVTDTRNGVLLSDYFDSGGLGVESLFLRYISGALKPGARAFVIVPLGLLNRTGNRMKSELLSECNVIASIALPRNAFFNTAVPTYILVLERRRTAVQSRPPVFCAIARSIGETLDHERVPTPDDNDLADIAELFVNYVPGDHKDVSAATPLLGSPIVKLVPSDEFRSDERWDVYRHWTDDEHTALGQRAETIDREEFIDFATQTLRDLVDELEEARSELAALVDGRTAEFSLSDERRFFVDSGLRITNADLRDNPGEVPVYSVFTKPESVKGMISAEWLAAVRESAAKESVRRKATIAKYPFATVMATGASAVGMVFYREPGCIVTDDVVIVKPWSKDAEREWEASEHDPVEVTPPHDIDIGYLCVALAQTIAEGGYVYEAKLYQTRVKQLTITVPVDDDGNPDIDRQRLIAASAKRLDSIRARLQETGAWSRAVRLA